MRDTGGLQTGQIELLSGSSHASTEQSAAALGSAVRAVPTNALISTSFSNFTRSRLAGDGVLSVFVNTAAGSVDIGGGLYGAQTIQALAIDHELLSFFNTTLAKLDGILDLDFVTANSQSQAEVSVFLDREILIDSNGTTLGIALSNSNSQRSWWELILNGPALSSQPDYLRYALIHELGHALGLEHPFDNGDGDVFVSSNPSLSAYPEETVMAYRQPMGGNWPTWYTDADLDALVQLWGKETTPNLNLSGPQYATYNVSNTYALNLLSTKRAEASATLNGNSFDYRFYNLGSARYGLQRRGQSQIDEITGTATLSFNDVTLSVANDVASSFNQVKGKDDVSGVVFRLYNAAFSRLPDTNGLQNWINGNTSGGQTYATSAKAFAASQEFKNRYGTNTTDTQYITTLYNNVLGRAPDAAGLANYQALLAGGRDRGALLLDFSESPENRVLFTQVTGLA